MSDRRRALWSLPWVLALVGLAVPMVGSGFTGWPFVVGWLLLMILAWWVRPLGGADRTARLAVGVLVVGVLALLGTLGGFYLIPSVVLWLTLVATEPERRDCAGHSSSEQLPHIQAGSGPAGGFDGGRGCGT